MVFWRTASNVLRCGRQCRKNSIIAHYRRARRARERKTASDTHKVNESSKWKWLQGVGGSPAHRTTTAGCSPLRMMRKYQYNNAKPDLTSNFHNMVYRLAFSRWHGWLESNCRKSSKIVELHCMCVRECIRCCHSHWIAIRTIRAANVWKIASATVHWLYVRRKTARRMRKCVQQRCYFSFSCYTLEPSPRFLLMHPASPLPLSCHRTLFLFFLSRRL